MMGFHSIHSQPYMARLWIDAATNTTNKRINNFIFVFVLLIPSPFRLLHPSQTINIIPNLLHKQGGQVHSEHRQGHGKGTNNILSVTGGLSDCVVCNHVGQVCQHDVAANDDHNHRNDAHYQLLLSLAHSSPFRL